MSADPFLHQRVAVLGLGLMGGSLALALRGSCAARVGVDPKPETLALALEMGAVDFATDDLIDALSRADLVVLAAPVRTNLALLKSIPRAHPGPLMILDLSSTKSEIVAAMNRLPAAYAAVGGHPMCGKETSGLVHADSKLFVNTPFALTETDRTTPELRQVVETLIAIVGAQPLWLAAGTHDRWAAAVSHLPYLTSLALADCTPQDAAPLISSGFQSVSRLAASDPTMMLDILTTNRTQLLAALERFQASIDSLRETLQNDDEAALLNALERARSTYQSLISPF